MLEWKKIGESCKTVSPPKKLEKELYGEEGLYPIIDQGQKDIVGYTFDESALVPNGEYILFGDHTRYVKYHKGVFAQGADGLKILRAVEGVLPRYFYFAFANTEVPSRGYSRHWSIAKEMLIPIPSLSEQSRIVNILDTFTASIENLKQQIAQRRKQYEHFRDQLLDLEGKEGVEMKMVGEVCELKRGVRVVKRDLDENGEIPVFQNCLSPMGFYKHSNSMGHTFVIIGGAAGDIGYCEKPFWAADDCLCISGNPFLIDKYVYVYLRKNQHYIKSQVRRAGVPRLSRSVIENLSIPVPSMEEQSRIVSILDTFEASIANLKEQLKEREKQYEYYRNKLLTFE